MGGGEEEDLAEGVYFVVMFSCDPENRDDETRPEYDFTDAVRGKYYERYKAATNVVVLDPDVAEAFKTPNRSTRPSVSS